MQDGGGEWGNAKTQGRNEKGIPAYAGMTGGGAGYDGGEWGNAKTQGRNEKGIPAYAGMTRRGAGYDVGGCGNDGRGCGGTQRRKGAMKRGFPPTRE